MADIMGSTVNDMRVKPTKDLIEIQASGDETSKTFIFGNEDHTLGNSLRHVLMQNPQVEFCGYSVPHPYEPKMNVRLQTHKSKADDVMVAGLQDLSKACDMIGDAFDVAVAKFEETKKARGN